MHVHHILATAAFYKELSALHCQEGSGRFQAELSVLVLFDLRRVDVEKQLSLQHLQTLRRGGCGQAHLGLLLQLHRPQRAEGQSRFTILAGDDLINLRLRIRRGTGRLLPRPILR